MGNPTIDERVSASKAITTVGATEAEMYGNDPLMRYSKKRLVALIRKQESSSTLLLDRLEERMAEQSVRMGELVSERDAASSRASGLRETVAEMDKEMRDQAGALSRAINLAEVLSYAYVHGELETHED